MGYPLQASNKHLFQRALWLSRDNQSTDCMPQCASDLIDVLKKTPLLAALAEAELCSLASRASCRRCGRNELLFSEGEPCKGLYIVATGLVRIFKVSPSGREHVLSLDGPGASLAELPVFDGGAYPASAAATKDSEVIFISRSDFRSLCLERPEVAFKLLEVVGGRLRRLVGIIEELSFTTVRQRLIRYLLRQAKTAGKQTGPACTFAIHDNYQAIASEIGTVRDLVSRTLARLQVQGLLIVEGREITIPDIRQLENEQSS
jgi:CRP/FNR family transcriptional regulator, cyclic AMP receptor protein